MKKETEELKYCAFIDVLGYGNLVLDKNTNPQQKLKMLESIYTNLATQFMLAINEVNKFNDEQIYIRSFSDCFYLDCTRPEPLLIAVKTIYEYVFGFYSSFTEAEERTPLLRCGIVKDWLIKFNDIGGMVNNTPELNPVGPAVARAYLVCEESCLSGMRIIVSPEVMADLNVLQVSIPEFKCFSKEMMTYTIMRNYYFKHVETNELEKAVELCEMLWPVNKLDDTAFECIDILKKIKPSFPLESKQRRHFDKTVQVFVNSLRMTSDSYYQKERYASSKEKLNQLTVD